MGESLRVAEASRVPVAPVALPAAAMPVASPATERPGEVAGVVEPSPAVEGEGASWPDDSAESAFLAEARDRGEPLAPARAKEEIADETDAKALPPLSELVNRIPAEVRETLEDLFRARFVTVKRVPKRALKT